MFEHQPVTADALSAMIQNDIDHIQDAIDAYDERMALQTIEDNKSTTERAQEALTRPERFRGEHAVATAWLREHATSIWTHGNE